MSKAGGWLLGMSWWCNGAIWIYDFLKSGT